MSEITKEYLDKTIHELKDELKEDIKDVRTEVGALFEDVHDKLDLILEGQTGILDNIKTIKNDHKNLEGRVSKTEIRVDVLEAR